MKKIVLVAAVMLAVGVAPGSVVAQSRPGGCLKYGLGGAVAGHFAGGHRLKGALAGCALGIYQRRKYEREVREQNERRNRNAERRRSPREEQANRYDNRDRSVNRSPLPRQEGTSPYEDLGLDVDRGRRNSGEQANRGGDRMRDSSRRGDGYEPGGSFARGQHENGDRSGSRERAPERWPRSYEPEATGSFPRANGRVY